MLLLFPTPSFPANFTPSKPLCLPHRRLLLLRCKAADFDSFTERSGYLFDLTASETDSLTEYSVSKIAAVYRRKPLILFRRLYQIGTTFGNWFALRYLDRVYDRSDLMFQIRAAELRKILVELGPAYIKIAQAISSRPDLIPPSYLDELSLLQDRISPFSTEVAFNTIEQELGLPIDEIFSEISPEPIAAASLGQVYQARLRRSGEVVAVKVQRPGVQAAISLDILILRFLAGLLRRAGKLNTDLQAVVDEWASSLFRGEKLSEVKDLYLVEVGVYCSFNQLLEYGFYHADPHPGNLLRTYDGKLAYLDFGMMGEFKQELRDGFIVACLHLVNRDFDALAKDFVTLGLLPPTADKEAVTKALTGVFQDAVAKGVRNISFGDLLGNLGTTMYKFKFQIPSYFSLVIRSLAVLEGIAISSNPDYKVLGSTYPWIARKVLTDSSPQLKSSLQNLLYEEGVFRIDRLESLLMESLRARTEKALVRKPAEETNSRVVVKQVLSFTLTEKGAFVRDILLQEIAKGLDALGIATLDSITSTTTASIPFISFFSFSSMTDEDKVNLRTLHRLMLLVSGHHPTENNNTGLGGVSPYKSQNVYPEEASLVFNQLASVQEILPILSVISELPPESQQQLFSLPADLVGRLISRVTARTIRRMFL